MATIIPSLSDEQRSALDAADDRGPVRVVDPKTNRTYILIRADLYDRFRALFTADEFDAAEAYSAMDDVARREGWLDPEMDAYDALDPRRPS
jgi:hypothetical protein